MKKDFLPVLSKYVNLFQDPIPKEIGKFNSSKAQLEKLEKLLQEQIDMGEPVKNWEEFANRLHPSYRRSNLAPKSCSSDSEPKNLQGKIIHRGNPEGLRKFRENLAKVVGVDLKSLERKH